MRFRMLGMRKSLSFGTTVGNLASIMSLWQASHSLI